MERPFRQQGHETLCRHRGLYQGGFDDEVRWVELGIRGFFINLAE